MSKKAVLRLTSLTLFLIAVIFVLCMMACPTCGHVFYIGPFRFGVEEWWVFYKCYAAVTAGLFLLSFFVGNKKK